MGKIIRIKEDFIKNTDLVEIIEQHETNHEALRLVVDKIDLFECINKIKKVCKLLSEENIQVRLIIDGNVNEKDVNDRPYIYTLQEVERLIELNNFLAENANIEQVGFTDERKIDDYLSWRTEKNLWSLQQVLDANEKLNAIVDDIKKLNLSPFETMLFIHDYVANSFSYNGNDLNRNSNATIMGAYQGDGLVCAGVSSLTKAIIDKLQIQGLSCEFIDASIHEDPDTEQLKEYEKYLSDKPELKWDYNRYKKYGSTERHRLCLIHLNDEKYNIYGSYLNDATWDNSKHSFAMCCYPVGDVLNFSKVHFVQLESDVDKAIGCADLDRDAAKLAKLQEKGKYIPYIVQKYGEQSKPIELSKYQKAIEVVCTSMLDEDEQITKGKVEQYLKNSAKQAAEIFTDKAHNKFVNSFENSANREV